MYIVVCGVYVVYEWVHNTHISYYYEHCDCTNTFTLGFIGYIYILINAQLHYQYIITILILFNNQLNTLILGESFGNLFRQIYVYMWK